MAAINDIIIPSLTLEEILSDGSTLTNPAADGRRLFLGEDGSLHLRDSAGAITDVGGAGTSAYVGCRASRTTSAQSISDATDTAVLFNGESGALDHDTSAFHSTSSNTSRFTVPTTGRYRCEAQVCWNTGITGTPQAYWVKNGATFYTPHEIPGTNFVMHYICDTIPLTAADYVELWVYQASGGPITVLATEATFAQVSFLGT